MKQEKKQNWYVPHPLHQYRENVKELAARAGLRIVDANVVPASQRKDEAEKPPKLTKAKADSALVESQDDGDKKPEA